MKKNYFAAMLASVLALAACTTTTPEVEPKLEVSGITGETVSVEAAGKDVKLSVKSNVAFAVVSDADWAVVDPASADNADNTEKTTQITISVAANETEDARTATIKINAEGHSELDKTIKINQAGLVVTKKLEVLTTDLKPVTETIAVPATGASSSVMVVSTVSWKATSDAEWLTVNPAELTVENYEETPTTVNFVITDNDGTAARTATVTFAAEGLDPVAVTVEQAAVCTFELAVSGITSSGAVIEVTPTITDAIYTVDIVSTEAFNSVGDIETLISYLLAGTQEDIAGYGYTLGKYYSEYGYSGNYKDDWNGYLAAETEYTAVVYALEIDGDNVTPYVSGAKTIGFKTLEMSFEAPEGLTPAKSKADYLGTYNLLAADLYAEDETKPYVYWPVTLTDGGNDDEYEYVTINNFLPYNSTAMPSNSYKLIYSEGYLYFAPGLVPYTDKFVFQGTEYDLSLYCLASTAATGNISTKMMMGAGFAEDDGTTLVQFKSLPSQTFNADGFYVSIPDLGGGLCGYYDLQLIPTTASAGSSVSAAVTRPEVKLHKALEYSNFKRVSKIR